MHSNLKCISEKMEGLEEDTLGKSFTKSFVTEGVGGGGRRQWWREGERESFGREERKRERKKKRGLQ
jgi:hypothetical protein